MSPKIGVLALQGAFAEHEAVLASLGVEAVEVRWPAQLHGINGLILPGGESTTMSLLMSEYGLSSPLKEMARSGFPVWGTCAGLVLLSRLPGPYPETLGVLDMSVKRNAFGRQLESFEADLDIPLLGERPFRGIFIRAPRIDEVGPSVEVLCRIENGEPVAARQGNLLCSSFHPELSGDDRLHRYFLEIVTASAKEAVR